MRILLLLTLVTIMTACTEKKEWATLRIKLKCTPAVYFNQLDNVLLTNISSDLDGKASKGDGLASLFSAKRIYIKSLMRNADGFFYVDSVAKAEYKYFYIDGTTNGMGYSGFRRLVDYSKSEGDTVETEICIEPNISIIQ